MTTPTWSRVPLPPLLLRTRLARGMHRGEMDAKVGDHIVVESETVGQPVREGEILEVSEGDLRLRYRVRWQDGHVSIFSPSAGSAQVVHSASGSRA